MRLWSTAPKPIARANSRARWRALTRSSSLAIGSRVSSWMAWSLAMSESGSPAAQPRPQHRKSLGRIEGGPNLLQFQPKLDQRDRHGRLDSDDDRLGAH